MKHAMIDLETFGVKDTAVILSIGAVQFDLHSGVIGSAIKLRIDPKDAMNKGMQLEVDTIKWWLLQNDKAREDLFKIPGVPLVSGLIQLSDWMAENQIKFVWGNSARFDMGKLVNAFSLCDIQVPWNTKDCERDFKTYNWQFPGYELWKDAEKSRAHEVIQDATAQIERLAQIVMELKAKGITLND